MVGKSAIHAFRHMLKIDDPHTQTTASERDALVRYAMDKKRGVEIGVFEGYNTRVLAEAMSNDGVLYAIDPFIKGRLGVCWGRVIAHREVARRKRGARVEFIEDFSFDAVKKVEGSLDLVFIDGDHSLDGIRRDWDDWSCKVEKGGVSLLHDTRVPEHNPRVESLGSYQYFESHIRRDDRYELVEQVDSLSVMRRL